MKLPPYAANTDFNNCKKYIKLYIDRYNIQLSEKQLVSDTLEIMNISYSHGGDYLKYFERFCDEFYKKGNEL
jgi:predicted solute-binding protein